MMSIVIAKTYRRLGDGALLQSYYKLMTGFIYKLVHYANNRGVRVTHFLATTWTPSGRTICELFGMKEIGKGKSGGEMWELDAESCRCNPPLRLTAGLRQLLQVYDQIPA